MKHTFTEYGVTVVNGELVEQAGIEKEYNFTLKNNGLKLFEQEFGKPLIKALTKILQTVDINKLQSMTEDSDVSDVIIATDGLIDDKFIRALACASYNKIEDNKAINNEQTVEEFKNSFVYDAMLTDIKFITELLNMAVSCIFEETKKQNNQSKRKVKN